MDLDIILGFGFALALGALVFIKFSKLTVRFSVCDCRETGVPEDEVSPDDGEGCVKEEGGIASGARGAASV